VSLPALDLPMPAISIVLAVLVTAGAAAVQGVVGFGYSIIAVPLLSLLDPRFAPVPQILTALPLTLFAAWRERGDIERGAVAWILAGRLPGFALGAVLVSVASARLLDAAIALSVLTGAACIVARMTVRRTHPMQLGTGFLSGVSGYVAGIGGPPLALLYAGARGATVRSTLGVLFAVGIVLVIGTRTAGGQVTALDLRLSAVLVAPVVAGTWASRFLHGAVEGERLRVAVIFLSVIAGGGLLLRAVLGGR